MITGDMRKVVSEHSLGYVATVDEDGTPSLSPKGTFRVLDDRHIGFAEMRSPRTLANIARQPVVEVNFIDVFSRRGYRFKGAAEVIESGAGAYAALLPEFAKWENMFGMFRSIVRIRVDRVLPISSPVYDMEGADEGKFRAFYKDYYAGL